MDIKTHKEEVVTKLPPQTIFVFGSNEGGRHGAGAALTARKYFGAIDRKGHGLMEQSYAIPTKDERLRVLSLDSIAQYVETFMKFAAVCPHLDFYLTRIGCGLAGYADKDIAPLFVKRYNLLSNIIYPEKWISSNDLKKDVL